jgi:hypothetical protein
MLGGIKDEHNFRVKIPWESRKWNDREVDWIDTSAWALEQFGLPGDKYSCKFLNDSMEFWFENEKDAIFFELRWG